MASIARHLSHGYGPLRARSSEGNGSLGGAPARIDAMLTTCEAGF